jgi:dTMP kinase
MKPQYIVIEGIDGAGKTTAISSIAGMLPELGVTDWITTREPGGTPLAEQIRQLVSAQQQETIHTHTEMLLMYASRVQLVHEVVKPALAKGKWVISDRHELSTRAYQGGGHQLPDEWFATMHQWLFNGFWPDLTLYLDLPPDIALARAEQRGALGRFEQLGIDFFTRVRNKYLQMAQQYPNIVVIDASEPLALVQQNIKMILTKMYRS